MAYIPLKDYENSKASTHNSKYRILNKHQSLIVKYMNDVYFRIIDQTMISF